MSISSLYLAAQSGKLTEDKLDQFMKEGDHINGLYTTNQFTPLMIAVLNGRHKVVQLLLKSNAQAEVVNPAGQTALWLAAAKTNKHRREIVGMLLDASHDRVLNMAPTTGTGNTPVMEAVQRGDEAVIRMLVDAGADLAKTNKQGKTAVDLSQDRKDKKAAISLLPASERHHHRLPFIKMVGNFFWSTVGWVNRTSGNAIRNVFGLFERRRKKTEETHPLLQENNSELWHNPADEEYPMVDLHPPAPKSVENCESVDDFKRYAEASGLERYFPKDEGFLGRLVDGIAAFKESDSQLNEPERLTGLVKLSLYQTIIYCDDSGSMKMPANHGSQVKRITALCNVVERITRICNLLTPDDNGVIVRFINNDVNWGPLSSDELSREMRKVQPKGYTDIGKNLEKKILQPYVDPQLDKKEFDRPLLICTITDGAPTDGDAFPNSIQACVKKIQDKELGDRVVSFIVCQIGDDSAAKQFLNDLDEKQQSFGDAVYICRDQLDDSFVLQNQNDDGLELRLFDILTTPLMR